jgi:hypothetical protein
MKKYKRNKHDEAPAGMGDSPPTGPQRVAPASYFIPAELPPPSPLTTSVVLTAEAGQAPITETKTEDEASSLNATNYDFVSPSLLGSSKTPVTQQLQVLTYQDKHVVTLARGVYLVCAQTGAGKTTFGMALAAFGNACMMPSTYLGVYEPRAQGLGGQSVTIQTGVSSQTPFQVENSQMFTAELRAALGAPASHSRLRLLIIDSVTLPLKTYAANKAFERQATFAGGSQPSDFAFLYELTSIADTYNLVILATINVSLITYASQLFGATEGGITLNSIASFNIQDRGPKSRRVPIMVNIPVEFVQAALTRLGLGTYNISQASEWGYGATGIPTTPQININE